MTEHDFTVEASETLYVGKIFALRADDVAMPGGRVARREVVEHFGAVAVVALDDEGRVAMVRQYRHPLGRRLWELPAGLLDVDGEAPQASAARELVEEAGLSAREWQVLVDLDSAPGFSDESVRVFLATGCSTVTRPEAHDEEADMTMAWRDLDDAVAAVFSGEICNSIAVAGLLAAQAARHDGAPVRTLRGPDAPWRDRPSRFAARRRSS